MKKTKLSGRYAKALHDFAIEQNTEEIVYQDILFLKDVFKDNRELRIVIESPIIVAAKKESIFVAIFQDKISSTTLEFLKLIITKRREPALMDIFESFIICYYQKHNIKTAVLTTAVQLSDTLLQNIVAMLEKETKATIRLEQVIDPKIIGGVMVRVDDFIYDASILGQVNRLKTEFSHNIYQASF